VTLKTLQILMALSDGPLHGYGIKMAVEERTGGEMTIGPGTLYEGIHRLLNKGWLEEVPEGVEDAPPAGGPPRRFYALTSNGREAARRELGRLAELVQQGKAKGLLKGAS
jgi:DNA-binding PadR family transcriptional regulator